jgi:hypothetical protein
MEKFSVPTADTHIKKSLKHPELSYENEHVNRNLE